MQYAFGFAVGFTVFNLMQACGGAPYLSEPIITPVNNPRKETSKAPNIDAELLEAVQQWKEDCETFSALHCGSFLNKIDAIQVVESFGPNEVGTIGRCSLSNYGFILVNRVVHIDVALLKRPVLLRAVLAHEMGHCAFLKNHVKDSTHLMAPYVISEKVLDTQLPAMLQRFYTDIQSNNLPDVGVFKDD